LTLSFLFFFLYLAYNKKKEVKVLNEKLYIFSGMEDLELKGLLTKEMIDQLGIPFEETIVHGTIETPNSKELLYNVPKPFDQISVLFTSFSVKKPYPNYYFGDSFIETYNLTPIGKNELPFILYEWMGNMSFWENKHQINFFYERKYEPRYRLRFLMEPDFDPYFWERSKSAIEAFLKMMK